MQPRIREVLDWLDASDRVLDEALAAVPEAVRSRRPGPERWSVAEILEHLSVVEVAIAGLLDRHLQAARAAGLGSEQSTEAIVPTVRIARLLDREATVVAGERVLPKAGLAWREAREALASARARSRDLIAGCDGLALGEIVIPNHVLGPINVYQWVIFLGAHEQRHAAQIREARGVTR